jgi:hypothetical protein
MLELGVATSIAKKFGYSWDHTIDFCLQHQLNLIQFYWQTPLPILCTPDILKLKRRYFHLDKISLSGHSEILDTCKQFKGGYDSDRLILHQEQNWESGKTGTLIRDLNDLGFIAGIENHDGKSLPDFGALIEKCCNLGNHIFVVLDAHKFFYCFHRKHSAEEIRTALGELLLFCHQLNLTLVLHIIDSHSFEADRLAWCPVFDGLIPYRFIFDIIIHNAIPCDGIILEYEVESHAVESIRRLRKYFHHQTQV